MAEKPQVIKEIEEEVEFFRDKYFVYDEPVPYKDWKLYPVYVKNYTEFLSSSACLTLNKNDSFETIKMTHIDYLVSKLKDEKEGPVWSMRFSKILELCLHIQNGLRCPKCQKFMDFDEYISKIQAKQQEADAANRQLTPQDVESILDCECGGKFHQTVEYKQNEETKHYDFILEGKTLTDRDFNRIRKYIMYQNLPDFKDDSWVDKAVRDDQAARAELMSRNSGEASLERKMVGLCVNTGYKLNEIADLTTRKFLELLAMIDDVIEYTTTKQGLMSGMVSLKKGASLEHWLYKKKSDSIYGAAKSMDSYVNEISSSGAVGS